ncbi:MAG: hypothetical protein AAF436_06535 [Myxococcota bacterium]
MRYLALPTALLVCAVLAGCGDGGADSDGGGDCSFESTFEAIQVTIFDARGCTVNACHGDGFAGSGNLDLRTGAAFSSLVRQPSSIDSEIDRVFPGDQDLSLLYRKVSESAASLASSGLGQAMPVGAEGLSDDQLTALRAWIRGGAPEEGVVEGTLSLLGCEGNFVADPNKINPLPPPAAGEGVQLYAGGWDLLGEAEDEVCYATYYDFTDAVPPEFRVSCDEFGVGRECFAFGRNELAQDGQSHHSIIDVYTALSDPNGGDWGPWACLGGDRAGEPCDPVDQGVCGERSACTTPVRTSVACIGYPFAPPDFSVGAGIGGGGESVLVSLAGAQESTSITQPPQGVYSVLPLQGFISWNSHGFNLTTKDTTIEQWVNLDFVPESGREWLLQQIFEADDIFAMSDVAPFEKREVCSTFTLPQYTRLTSLSSHMHERGELFRIWLPPNEPCSSPADCGAISRQPDYESRLYDDPVYTYYEPPLPYDAESESDRTFLACARYDNGADNPAEVKRNSLAPNTPVCSSVLANCGCPASERVCLGGPNQGMSCNGDDARCTGEFECDACPVSGGVTTVDEMFIPLGSYYVQPPSP